MPGEHKDLHRRDRAAFERCARRRLERAAERAALFRTLGREELVEAMERAVRDALAVVRDRVEDLAPVPLSVESAERFEEVDTLVLVAQRPHIFYQCRPAVERAFGAERVSYVVDSRHLMDLEMMEHSNLFGYPDGDFSAESPAMQGYAGGQERVVLLGKDALFPNAVEAALSLGAPETLYMDFYGNTIPLTERTLDEHAAHAEVFRSRWTAQLEQSDLLQAVGA